MEQSHFPPHHTYSNDGDGTAMAMANAERTKNRKGPNEFLYPILKWKIYLVLKVKRERVRSALCLFLSNSDIFC